MKALFLLVGIPASGKSTAARQMLQDNEADLIVSSDDIREELTGDIESMERNGEVFDLLNERLLDGLRNNLRVIVDATNLRAEYRESLGELADLMGAPRWAIVFSDSMDYALCQKRNLARDRNVPEDVMQKMHTTFMVECKAAVLNEEGWNLEMRASRESF